jgi:hypothetical protein
MRFSEIGAYHNPDSSRIVQHAICVKADLGDHLAVPAVLFAQQFAEFVRMVTAGAPNRHD